MPHVWVSLGSNIDRERCIRGAVAALRGRFHELTLSKVYESEAVGFDGQPFYNLVLGFRTEDSPAALCRCFREIEDAFGRERGCDKFSPRTLDIDLLTYGDRVVRTGGIALPREEIIRYAFVLMPLADVAGDEVHPQTQCTYRALWDAFDRDGQSMWPVELDLG